VGKRGTWQLVGFDGDGRQIRQRVRTTRWTPPLAAIGETDTERMRKQSAAREQRDALRDENRRIRLVLGVNVR
jgi:hypothetical protein